MARTTWGTIYCLIGAGLVAAMLLLVRSIRSDSEPLALAGIACCLSSLSAAHFTAHARWLKVSRSEVQGERDAARDARCDVVVRESLLENRRIETLRELERIEQENTAKLTADRAAMLAEVEANAYEYKRIGFEQGFKFKTGGVASEDMPNGARVLHLPVGQRHATTMGQGALYN
jgi:hypothetical protein